MVDRIESRRVVVPATFGSGDITFTDLGFPAGIVREVAIIVPHGVRNSVGVGLGYSGVVVIPNTDGELIYTDGEVLTWPVDGLPVGVQWQLVTDPQGYAEHAITVRMAVDEITRPVASPVLPVEIAPAPVPGIETAPEITTAEPEATEPADTEAI